MAKKTENRGGAREGAGRPKNPQREEFLKIYADIKNHANEMVGMRDKKTNQIIKKKRILFLLDTLYTIAINDKNVYAIKEYLDRSIGRSRQYVDIDDVSDTKHLEALAEIRNEIIKKKKNSKKNS